MQSFVTSLAALLIAASATTTTAGDLVNVAGASGIAIDGYDPVAFFTEGKPVHGSPSITATHRGATYLFANEANRKRFSADPDRYVPQYGGYCAYGVSVGALFPVDVSTWQVRNGKLYLNLNPEILSAFNADFEGAIAKAEKNWPALRATNVK